MTAFILAEFATAHEVADAARDSAVAGHPAWDALLPNPIDDIAEHLAPPPAAAPVGWVMVAAGSCGALAGYGMQWYSAVIAYPIQSGGRPLNSWPVFLPVPYEITILLAAICGIAALLFMCGLPKLHHPLFAVDAVERGTQDRYFLLFRRDATIVAWLGAHATAIAVHEIGE